MTYVTREEFGGRMSVLEGEVEGEKAVTRHILEQVHRNGDEISAVRSDVATLKSRLDHVAGDVALVKAALTSQTALLKVLVQDVGQFRQEMRAMREDIATIRAAVAPRDPP